MQRARTWAIARAATAAMVPVLAIVAVQVVLWPTAQPFPWLLVLTAMLAGMWLGGCVADRLPSPRWLTFLLGPSQAESMQAALAETNAELNRAQAVANIGSWRLDPVTDHLYGSEETYRIYEIPSETSMSRRNFLGRVVAEDLEAVRQAWFAAFSGCQFDVAHRIVTDSGVKWVRQRAVLDLDSDGVLRGAIGTVQDITAAKAAENALRESEARMRLVLDSTGDGIFGLDEQGRCMFINRSALRLLGYQSADELIGTRLHSLIQSHGPHGPQLPISECAIYRAGTERRSFHSEDESFRRADGHWFDVEYHAAPIIRDGEPMGIVVSFDDITERKRTEALLRRAAIVFDNTREGIFVTDAQRRILTVNPAFTEISGYSLEEVQGRVPDFLHAELNDEAFRERLWSTLEKTGQWQGELTSRRKNGEVHPAWGNLSTVRNEDGEVTHYVAILADISALKEAEQNLRYLAHHDALTDLPNRLLFQAHLAGALERAKRHDCRVALLFLDLDRFKLINDTLGHGAGDDLLVEVARRLRDTVRAEDMVARQGGDEFTVTMEAVRHPDDAAHLATKLIDVIVRPILVGGRQMVVSGSIGISLYPDDANTVEELVKTADAAMYRAKERGRNGFEFHTPEISARAREHLALENGLRAALEDGDLQLYFQPQIDIATRRLVGAEALLRWNHPDNGLILPGRFIAIAEESDLIEQVGDWVIQEVCAQIRRWREKGLPPIRVGVNLAGRQMEKDVTRVFAAALSANGLQTGEVALEVEVTETVLQSIEHGARKLDRLRERGVRIAIDDFGTGYSSLSRLQHLPLDTLKIDQAFIHDLPEDKGSRTITRAVIAMGRSLGLRVLAEGVETERQFDFLRDEGCDEIQGFLFGKPVPAADLERRMRAD